MDDSLGAPPIDHPISSKIAIISIGMDMDKCIKMEQNR